MWGAWEMKVHAFRVEPQGVVTLPEVLERISKRPFRDRRVTEGKFAMRLEASRKRKKQWSLEFVLIRELGPGLAAMNAPLTDFDMADTDGFGEETAGFYDEQTNFMTLQYNHFGPRVGRIQSYLSAFAQKINPEEGLGFFFTPVIHPDAGDRLTDMRVVKKLEVTGYLP